MFNNKSAHYNDASNIARIILAMQPTRKRWWWFDDLHKIFVKAVAYHGGPRAAKPVALQQTMEAMGVRGLTVQNIKSHLQKYRSKNDSEAGAPDDMLGTTSPGKAALNPISDMVMDADAVQMEIEAVKKFLMDDIEMVENNFSVDELQIMEKELMSEIQLIELNSESPQPVIDVYIDYGLAGNTSDCLNSADISL